jgi:agmatinase
MEEKMIITPVNAAPAAAKNFCGLDEEYSGFKRSKVAVLQVPYDRTTTYKHGTRGGPEAIIEASRYLELFDDELNQETYRIGVHTMAASEVENMEPEAMLERLYSVTQELLKSGKFPVILGGEHSITAGAVRAFKEAYPNLSVLQLDAHYDLKDEYRGSKLNHGCAARRILDICPLVQVGMRSLAREEKDFLASQANGRIKSVSVYDILDMPLWKDAVSNALTENVYVTIDLDVFDPSVMPAVGTPEPGGIGWYETLDLLREVAKDKRIVGFDVVELCPIKGEPASDFIAAKLVYRLLGYIFPVKR